MEIALAYRQAGNREHVGGDIIDVYRLLSGRTVLSIADISGKGVKAAVDAAFIKYSMRAYASEGFSPERILRSLNRLYNEKNVYDGEESFVTAFVASFDPTTNVLRYASAAHEPVVISEPGRPAYELAVTAPLLALFEESGRAVRGVKLQGRTAHAARRGDRWAHRMPRPGRRILRHGALPPAHRCDIGRRTRKACSRRCSRKSKRSLGSSSRTTRRFWSRASSKGDCVKQRV